MVMIFALDLLLIVTAIFLIIAFIMQIIIPLVTGEPLLPFFRKSPIQKEISKVEQTMEEVAEIKHLNKVLDEMQHHTSNLEKKE